MLSYLILMLLSWRAKSEILTIGDYGAIPNENTLTAAFTNSDAFAAAFKALKSAPTGSKLIIPSNSDYYSMPVNAVSYLNNKIIEINGKIIASNNISHWPLDPNDSDKYLNFWQFNNCTNLTVTSNKTGTNTNSNINNYDYDYDYITGENDWSDRGLINGQGWDWWTLFAFNKLNYSRPHLLVSGDCINLRVINIRLIDSPNFHLSLRNSRQLLVENVIVWVNISQQENILKSSNKWDYKYNIPMFPFNTDGIDVAGYDIIVRNCSISNYDDSVCIKPSKLTQFGSCSRNILVENCKQIVGAGMSVGSVPPNDDINCIENVLFKDIYFYNPLKAIYVKTNSGQSGYGRVKNITYSNMVIRGQPTIWPIDLGPQQQKEPNGNGDGCFLNFWQCEANPRVNMSDIYLYNVSVDEPITNPGIMSCNETNPCTGFVFDNVSFVGDSIEPYVCQNIYGTAINSYPSPWCFK